ncbi:glycosyltransferase family 2 protein [Planococcus liqunii]|uniref:glycosyltransferase family 2 protein n=1 Tax=Planococcus liqunii TaxID=3058394 RepID=UPI00261EC50A|nr:glycosyltransferase family 2 protein [Planococcus sp. N056]WKA50174.1 glycosyltransferase family 2 protein [Planococcus sp. N056]
MEVPINNVLVSIVIPTYGRPEKLKRSIESALSQTYPHIEVVVVDDNNPSTEARLETEQLMSQYTLNENVVYVKHNKNKNGAAARNTGVKNSRGTIISYLDDDDYYLPEKIEKDVYYLMENPTIQGVCCGRITRGKEVPPPQEGDLSKAILLMEFSPTTSTLMFYKDAIQAINGFTESYRRHQDYEFLLRFLKVFKLGRNQECLVVTGVNEGENHLHGNELEELKLKFFNQFEQIIKEIDFKTPGFKKELYTKHYVPVFWDHISKGYVTKAMKVYMRFVFWSPMNFTRKIIQYFFSYIRFLLGSVAHRGD